MSLQFISNSVLRGDASFSTGSAALFQSSGNNTTSDTWIYNSGSLANGYQLDFGHGIARTSTNIIMSLKGGNVGIGTTSPRGKLDIVGNTDNDTDFLTIQDNDTSAGSHRPSIRFRSDTAQIGQIVGLDNSMRFSVGTTETSLLEIASSGNIGIGTTGPTALLEVKKDNATIYDATSDSGQDNNTATVLVSNDNVTTNTFSQIAFHNKGSNRGISRIVSIGVGSASTDLAFVTENNNTKAEKMRITSAGNVGIGTTSPNYALDIEKDTGSLLNLYRPNSSTAAASFLDFSFNTANATEAVYARIRSDVEVNTNSAQGGDLSFHTANSGTVGEVMRLTQEGNVGIGNADPQALLHITGTVNTDDTKLYLTENTNLLGGYFKYDGDANVNYLGGLDTTESPVISWPRAGSSLRLMTGSSPAIDIDLTRSIQFNEYSGTNKTGTPTYMLGTDASGNVVKVLGGDIPGGGGTVTGTGTAEYIPKWNSTSALVNSKAFQSTASSITTFNIGTSALTCDFLNYQDTTGSITGKVPIIEAKAALIGIGARDKTYTTIYEGIKIIPATSHYLTRITPRLEVYPYEDPSTTTDNTYDSSFSGSCFSMGSQNTIGDSTSSNLGIFGFNNTITGDKFVIIGQGNVLGKANVSSLAVGTTNTNSGNGKLVNSLLVGQNMTLTQPATRSIVAGINHSFQGAMNNTVIIGSGNQGFGSNNFIWGSANQGSGINNIMLGGFSCQITSSSGNRYGSALMGWNNTLQAQTRGTFITGRDNIIVDTDYSIMGGYNNDTSANHSSLLVGTKNYGRGTGNITGGESNTHESNTNNYNLMVGFNNKTYQNGANSLIAGITNEIGSASNMVVGQNNKVKNNTKNNIVGGNANQVLAQVASSQFNENNILSGLRNEIYIGSNNIVNGLQNDIGINANSNSKVQHSIVIGSNNRVGNQSLGTIANKSNMAVFGSTNNVRGNNTFVAGSNNGAYTDNAIILGSNNSAGGVSAGESKVVQIGFAIQPNSQSDYLAIGYGMTALPTTAVDNQSVANKYTAIGRNPDNNVDYDLSSLDPVSFIVGAGTQQNFRRTAIAVTCKNSSSEESNVILPGVGKYRNYTNDTTAAAGGVPIYGLYHTSGTVKIRLT